jgi:hypothetical protein
LDEIYLRFTTVYLVDEANLTCKDLQRQVLAEEPRVLERAWSEPQPRLPRGAITPRKLAFGVETPNLVPNLVGDARTE